MRSKKIFHCKATTWGKIMSRLLVSSGSDCNTQLEVGEDSQTLGPCNIGLELDRAVCAVTMLLAYDFMPDDRHVADHMITRAWKSYLGLASKLG